MLCKRIDSVSQLAGTHHEAIAIIVVETGGLLTMKGKHFSQSMESSSGAVTAMNQYVDRLVRIDSQRTLWAIVARTKTGNVQHAMS
jgi:hypothetical protein